MIVSISRELGAGGWTIGSGLAAALGATLLDERAIIAELSKREGYSQEHLAARIERPPSLGQTLMSDLARAAAMLPINSDVALPEEAIIASVRGLVFEYALQGHVVVIGHGGRSLFGWRPPDVRVLALLVHGGRAWRIARLAERLGLDRSEAERRIARVDEARQRFQKHFFDSNMYESRLYDLVLNAETLGIELASSLALRVARAFAGEPLELPSAE
ncbi:MAG: AAA family ATPase [Vulcanimicrobiaceae bacterium]